MSRQGRRRRGTRTADFLAKNPNGKVPLLELEDGRLLAESNAMLLYLAEGTRLLPADRYERGLAYQWLFFEQYSHEPYIAVRRALMVYPDRATKRRRRSWPRRWPAARRRCASWRSSSQQDAVLRRRCDERRRHRALRLYARGRRGGFDLAAYPAVSAWLERVEADPGHVPMGWLPNRTLRGEVRLSAREEPLASGAKP